MDYQQYLEAKSNCEKKIKIFSAAIHLITLLSLVQAALLIFKINFNIPYVNMIVLDKFFSLGYSKFAEGNVVFAIAFYGAFGLIIAAFVLSSIYSVKGARLAYSGVIFLYAVDSILCIATVSLIQLGVHVLLLGSVILAFRYRNMLRVLKNNVWGYN